MKFVKAHGLGNDFLLVERGLAPSDVSAWARRLCHRNLGAGADGILLFRVAGGRVEMRLINPDGSDGDVSGNGVRCLAAYCFSRGWLPASHTVVPPPGPRPVVVHPLGGTRYRVETDLGVPRLAAAEVPALLEPPTAEVLEHALEAAGRRVRVTAVSLGNPHCALFCDEPASDALVAELGPALERHPFFPKRANVEFVTVVSRTELRVRLWERGVGPTLSSGTCSASAAVAAIRLGLAERSLRVVCDGGVLETAWPEGGSLRQVGEAELVYEADWLASA